jgi:selenocysteine lyase/cysteine desulfurase
MVGFVGLAASLALLARFGLSCTHSPLADRVLDVTDYALERLRRHGAKLVFERDRAHASGIVTFALPGHDPQLVRASCLERGIALSVRAGGLRISIHAYNDSTDIDRMVDVLPPIVGDHGA